MKQLTVNQIMLLLDIYRGTNTQNFQTVSTHKYDLNVLQKKQLIIEDKDKKGNYLLTKPGKQHVEKIKAL